MKIALFLLFVLAIVVLSILRAFGNVVGAGGNLQKSLGKGQGTEDAEICEEPLPRNSASQIARSIVGVLFGVLMLCPVLYGTRINGTQYFNIDHQVRFYLVGFLCVAEVIAVIAMLYIDRNSRK
jgi:hypothetical protein